MPLFFYRSGFWSSHSPSPSPSLSLSWLSLKAWNLRMFSP
jgi:hypothetical protein